MIWTSSIMMHPKDDSNLLDFLIGIVQLSDTDATVKAWLLRNFVIAEYDLGYKRGVTKGSKGKCCKFHRSGGDMELSCGGDTP